jgi:hypothetical protein
VEDAPAVEQGHPRGDPGRLGLVVGHVQRRPALGVVERAQLVEETLADRLVQAIEWLIQEQHAWPGRHGPCDGDSLLLPARELVRVAPAQPVQTDQIQRRVYPCLVLAFWHPTVRQPERHVLADRQVREQQKSLVDHRHAPTLGRQPTDLPIVEVDPAVLGRDQPGLQTQDGRLAAAPEECHTLAGRDIQGEAVQDQRAPESDAGILDTDRGPGL